MPPPLHGRTRPALARLAPATHGGPTSEVGHQATRIDFSSSVNAYGPAPIVVAAARAAPLDAYPDPTARGAREAAAARWSRPIEEILFGAGTAELIYATAFALIRPGDTVLIPRPAFAEYGRATLLAGGQPCRPARVPVTASGPTIASEFIRAVYTYRPSVAFLATPTNPIGTALTHADISRVAEACALTGTLLVLDQAYDAFAAEPLGVPALGGHPAVVHLASMTKDHALAGVRVGFAIGPVSVVAAIDRVRPPWSTSAIAQAAAIAALSDSAAAHVAATVPRLRASAALLRACCAQHGLPVAPSATHYMAIDVTVIGGAVRGRARLRAELGLGVRDCTSFGLPRHIRVAARTDAETQVLADALITIKGSHTHATHSEVYRGDGQSTH